MKNLLIGILTLASLNSFADTAITCSNDIMSFDLSDNDKSHTLSFSLKTSKSDAFTSFLETAFSNDTVSQITGGVFTRQYSSSGRYTSNWSTYKKGNQLVESLIFNMGNVDGNISFTNSVKTIVATMPLNRIPVAHYELLLDDNLDPQNLELVISYYKDLKIKTTFQFNTECTMTRRPNTSN